MKSKTALTLLIIIVIVSLLSYMILTSNSHDYVDKSCNSNKDCTFTDLSCCSLDPVNKQSAWKIKLINKLKEFPYFIDIRDRCSLVECLPPGHGTEGAIMPRSICKNERCIVDWKINCNEYCQQLEEGNVDTIESVKRELQKTRSELNEECSCV